MATPPYTDADPLALYRYFPSFIKLRDADAGTDDAGEAVLQKITYMLEKEAGAHVEMLRRLLFNLDPDNCAISLVDYLAFIFGEQIPGDWTDDRRRRFLKQLPDLLKVKGLHLGFARRAAFIDRRDLRLVELTKHELYETCDYSDTLSSWYLYRAARVDVGTCWSACESYCEFSCESAEEAYERVPASTAEGILNSLGEVLPVNVLLRRDCVTTAPAEYFPDEDDFLGCHSYCESFCESACESNEESWPGSEVQANLREGLTFADSWAYTTVCVSHCEAACQTCCECGWETTCGTGCETECQVVCESVCQSTCMVNCQTTCQAGACEWGCEVYEE